MRTILTIIALMSIAWTATISAKQAPATDDTADLYIDENINTPAVGKKAHDAVVDHMKEIARRLRANNIDTKIMRNDEVVVATLPCERLFEANQTSLKPSARKLIEYFSPLLKHPTMYKVIVAVHSDNTGDEQYLVNLTNERGESIIDYLRQYSGTRASNVLLYGMADDEPLLDNNTMANRAKNRRVEIYIVPEKNMIEMASSGRLK